MSNLTDLYDSRKTPPEDRIQFEKNILLLVPGKKHDISSVLNGLGLASSEVSITWPKGSIGSVEEVEAFGAKLTLAVDCELPGYPSVNSQDQESIAQYNESVRDAITDLFVGLHHHDEFSIKDGLGSINQLIKLLKAQKRSFCAITNHGSVGGWIKQYNACKKAGIKAIFGMEAYVSNYRGTDPEQRKAHRSANHLVLLANTEEGFYNIIRIHNDAQLNGFYYTPRVNREAVGKWGKGIIGMSACMAGEIPRLLMADKYDEAKETYEFYNRVFDKFYIEIQIIEMEEQREANRRLIKLARDVGAPIVLTCDSHYLDSEYAESHDVLMCLRQKKTIVEKREKDDVWSFDVRNLFYRDALTMYKVFDEGFTDDKGENHPAFRDDVFTDEVFIEAMENTRKIAVGTQNIVLDSAIKLPRLYANGKEVLRTKINEGFAARNLIKKENREEYLKRIKYEFEAITRMGWGDYFLVMEKIITDTRAKFGEWCIGYGRGSAAGSLVSYCLGLTAVDPIEYGLLFERFLEEGRPDPPDIDTDFDPRIRDWVKQHIVEVFGANNVCSIGTYQTYKTRAVILDVARALGENLAEVSTVTKRIEPLRAFEDDEGVEQKVDQMDFDDLCKHYPELQAYFELHPEVRRHAEILRNQVKNMGTHAGGVIISDLDLRDRIPVLYDKPSSENRQVISAWAESGSVQELSSVGLVKYDILGLNNLPVISDCVKLIETTTGTKIDREDIPISDREAIYLGSKRDLVGIFQFENPQTKPIADAVGMESLDDVAAITSLIRPGPMDAMIGTERMPMEYARRKKGGLYEAPEFLRKALAGTYGLIVYQEDVMRISRVLSGFTAPEANKLRKAAGKKIVSLMQSIREKFIKGAKPRIDAGEITPKEVEELWEQIETFAGYGFNKSVDIDTSVWCNGEVKKVGEVVVGDSVVCFDGNEWVKTDVVANHNHGVLPAFEVTFDEGEKVVCSIRHKFETENGKVPLWRLIFNGEVICAKEDDKFNLQVLSESISYNGNAENTLRGVSESSNTEKRGRNCVCRMRGEVSQREGMSEASKDLYQGDRCCECKPKGEMRAESFEGSESPDGNDTRRKGCHWEEGGTDSGRNVECDCHKKKDIGEIESHQGIPGKSVTDSDSDLKEGRLAIAAGQESEALGNRSSRRVFSEFIEGENGLEEFEVGRMAVEGITVSQGRIPAEDSGSLQDDSQRSGLCESRDLDRGGRVLAFRNGLRQEEVFDNKGSREGCLSKSGSGETRDSSDSVGVGLLEREWEIQTEGRMVEDLNESFGRTRPRGVSTRKVLSARFVGFRQMCDLEVSHSSHNYVLTNGIVSSNSHAVSYGAITTVEMWLKHNFPIQYITALVNNTKLGKKKHGSDNILKDYLNYARRREITVLGPDVNMSGDEFRIEGDAIRFALGTIKNVATAAGLIEKYQPFTGMEDFYERVKVESDSDEDEEEKPQDVTETDDEEKTEVPVAARKVSARRPNRKVIENLIAAGAFDRFGTRNEMAMAYWRLRRKPNKKDKLKAKIPAAEQKVKEVSVLLLQSQAGGVAKEIKKAEKEFVKAEMALVKAKKALEEDDKVDAIVESTPDGTAKDKKDLPPEDLTEDQWHLAETEVLGMCLSKPVLYKNYEEQIKKEGWYLISDIPADKKKVLVFGEITSERQHISKAGNSMHIITLNDGIDTMSFFVFQGGWQFFKDNYRVGTIGAVPMAKFDDSDNGTRFFDDRSKCVVIQK